MFYAILGIVVVVALILIFRDDHDTSYNRNEKKAQRQSEGARQQSAYSKKVFGMIGSIIEEVKKEAAEPLQDIQKGVQGVMDEAKAAIDKAVEEARQKHYWTSSTDVDEQEQPEDEEPDEEDWEDEEEMDLSFLDTLDYYEDLEENTETFDITGLRYHCTVKDCGKIVGVVKPEPSNVHDNRAQAVIRSDGKLLGYIPRTQLDWYEDFNDTIGYYTIRILGGGCRGGLCRRLVDGNAESRHIGIGRGDCLFPVFLAPLNVTTIVAQRVVRGARCCHCHHRHRCHEHDGHRLLFLHILIF